jgi:hypothetical protein
MLRRKKHIKVEEEEEEEEEDFEVSEEEVTAAATTLHRGLVLTPGRRANLLSLVREDCSADALLDRVVAFLTVHDALELALTCVDLMTLPSHATWARLAMELGAQAPVRFKEEGGCVKTWKNAFLLGSGFACGDCRLAWDFKLSDMCAAECGRFVCTDCAQSASCCGQDKKGHKYCLFCTNFSCCGHPKCAFTVCNICQTVASYPEVLPLCVCGMRTCPAHACRCQQSRLKSPAESDYSSSDNDLATDEDEGPRISVGSQTTDQSTAAALLSTVNRILEEDSVPNTVLT